VHLHLRETASPAVREQLAFRDLLRADAGARAEYAGVKRRAVEDSRAAGPGETAYDVYLEAKSPWVRAALRRALEG
jgi:dephospho-CoA kinase